MYSGTTLTPLSGRVLGAHQRIDRLARSSLGRLLPRDEAFPSSKRVLHFEGVNGPDAIKRKSPAQDEPWHYYSPFDEQDTQLLELIGNHYDRLVEALAGKDEVRAAFEAAWLAHALVDGLTPAHHYPYEQKLAELRGGLGLETRDSLKDKLIMPGETRREQVSNNWKMWGPKGLLASHGFFEWGIALLLKAMTIQQVAVQEADLLELREFGVLELFRRKAREIGALNMYERYQKTGWTTSLARQARKRLVPVIVRMVTLAWFAACVDAGLARPPKIAKEARP